MGVGTSASEWQLSIGRREEESEHDCVWIFVHLLDKGEQLKSKPFRISIKVAYNGTTKTIGTIVQLCAKKLSPLVSYSGGYIINNPMLNSLNEEFKWLNGYFYVLAFQSYPKCDRCWVKDY